MASLVLNLGIPTPITGGLEYTGSWALGDLADTPGATLTRFAVYSDGRVEATISGGGFSNALATRLTTDLFDGPGPFILECEDYILAITAPEASDSVTTDDTSPLSWEANPIEFPGYVGDCVGFAATLTLDDGVVSDEAVEVDEVDPVGLLEGESLDVSITTSAGVGAITLVATGLPAGATFTDNGDGTGTLSLPDSLAVGEYTVAITAADDTSTSDRDIQIEVLGRMPTQEFLIGRPQTEFTGGVEDELGWNNIGLPIARQLVDGFATAYLSHVSIYIDGNFLDLRLRTGLTSTSSGSEVGPDLNDALEAIDDKFTIRAGDLEITLPTSALSSDTSEPYRFTGSNAAFTATVQAFVTGFGNLTTAQKEATTLTLDDGTVPPTTVAVDVPIEVGSLAGGTASFGGVDVQVATVANEPVEVGSLAAGAATFADVDVQVTAAPAVTPITLDTIPAQTGEVARFLVTVGTVAQWYREGVTGSLTGDAEVVAGLTINRVRLENNDIILNRAGTAGFIDHFSGSGAGVDAEFRFAFMDGSSVDTQLVSLPADLDTAGGGYLRLMPSASVYSAIAGRTVGDLVNVVISNFEVATVADEAVEVDALAAGASTFGGVAVQVTTVANVPVEVGSLTAGAASFGGVDVQVTTAANVAVEVGSLSASAATFAGVAVEVSTAANVPVEVGSLTAGVATFGGVAVQVEAATNEPVEVAALAAGAATFSGVAVEVTTAANVAVEVGSLSASAATFADVDVEVSTAANVPVEVAPLAAGASTFSGVEVEVTAAPTGITLDTIPAQTGEVARFLVTVGTLAEWYRAGVTGSLTGDAEIVAGLTINRIRVAAGGADGTMTLNRAGTVGFSEQFSGSGAGVDAQLRFAYDDGSDIEIQTVSLPADLDDAGGGFLRLMPPTVAYSAIVDRSVGDLVNVVISNFAEQAASNEPVEVDALAAGAATFSDVAVQVEAATNEPVEVAPLAAGAATFGGVAVQVTTAANVAVEVGSLSASAATFADVDVEVSTAANVPVEVAPLAAGAVTFSGVAVVSDAPTVVVTPVTVVVTPVVGTASQAPKVGWLLKVTTNDGTVHRWWSRAGTLSYDGQTWDGAAPIINVGPSESTRGLPGGRTAITINAAAVKNLRVQMLKDIGPAPAEVHRIKDVRDGNGWVDMGHSTIGTLSAPQQTGGLIAFTIETRRGLVLKLAKMWDHASQKRRDEDDDFFEYKAELAGQGIRDTGFPPRRN